MKKYLVGLLLTAVMVPVPAFAAQLYSGDEFTVGRGERIGQDIYSAGRATTVSGIIEGDLIAVGGTIVVDGTVTQDVVGAGGVITISGTIGDDVRVAGGTIVISGTVRGDVVVAGGQIHITSAGSVGGDVIAAGGRVDIDGSVGGIIKIHKTGRIDKSTAFLGFIAGWSLVKFLMLLVSALVVGLVFRRMSRAVAEHAGANFWSDLLTGLIVLIVVPLVALLALLTFIGVPVGAFALLCYLVLLFLARILAAVFLGAWIHTLITRHSGLEVTWFTILYGSLGMTILSMIPFVGWAIACVVFLAAFGAVCQLWYERDWKHR